MDAQDEQIYRRMCMDCVDVEVALKAMEEDLERLKQGRQQLERLQEEFRDIGEDNIAELLGVASRFIKERTEVLEEAIKAVKEEVEKRRC